MSFRFYPERIDAIGRRAGTVGEDLLIPVPGIDGMRITIPELSVNCGADAQSLSLLQVESLDIINTLEGSAVTPEELSSDLAGRLVALETQDGDWLFDTVTATSSGAHSFTEDLSEVKEGGRFLLMAEEDSELNQKVPLAADAEIHISDPAPGRLIARDFCFPVVISISNDITAVSFNAATVVYICR